MDDFIIFETEDGDEVEYEILFTMNLDEQSYALIFEWNPFIDEDDLDWDVIEIKQSQGEIVYWDFDIDLALKERVREEYVNQYTEEEG